MNLPRESDLYRGEQETLETLRRDLEEERTARMQLERTVTGLQQELIKAGKFTHDDSDKRLEGVQWLLRRAGEYAGRSQKRGRR